MAGQRDGGFAIHRGRRIAHVARRTAPGGTFATYSAASGVRAALAAAGFDVTRAPGFGAKRHMSRGVLRAS